jgi:protein TonB
MDGGGMRRGGEPNTRWGQRLMIGVVLLLVAGALVWGGMNLTHGATEPKRQVARIMILPDTPPPPPPPPDEKKPPPKEEQTRTQQQVVPKQETPPAPAQLKMEGAAGEGPSAFASGDVKQDYIGGDIGNGSKYSAYIARLEQRIQVELTRHKLRVANVKLFVWLAPDGTIQRYKVEGGDGDTERNLRSALSDFSRADEAPLADMPMPVGLSIN